MGIPDKRVSDQIHVIAQVEVHKGVGWAEIVAVRARQRVNECPLQIVLRDNLVELLLDQTNVFVDLFQAPAEPRASRQGAVDGRVHINGLCKRP